MSAAVRSQTSGEEDLNLTVTASKYSADCRNVSDVYGQNLKTGDLTVSSPWRGSENRQKTGELPLFCLPDTSNPDRVVSDYKQIPKRTFLP